MEGKKEQPYKKVGELKPLKPSGKSSNLSIENRYATPRGFGNAKAKLKGSGK